MEQLATQREEIMDEFIHSGLNQRILLSDKFHDSKPWISKFFFGRPRKEHKARGEACFGEIVSGFTCNVSGEGEITDFEKYCMCCMIKW